MLFLTPSLKQKMSTMTHPDSLNLEEIGSSENIHSQTEHEKPFEGHMEAKEPPPHEELDQKKEDTLADGVRNEHLDHFMKAMSEQIDAEAKLKLAIDFMEMTLAQSGTPHFKNFWEVRAICLQLFKENISPPMRAMLWAKYSSLSKEARRLKELLDEQSAFASEQIDIAIKALEAEIILLDQQRESGKVSGTSEETIHSLGEHDSSYQNMQNELDVLNAQASRINALRKELIKTEMRVRKKNQFFQRLSSSGDKVFPRRKELIKDVSQLFMDDVDAFINTHFAKENLHDSLSFLREKIKSLQGIAKLLTLNTHAFTHTRKRLSECWDKIKLIEKERKKIRAQQKSLFKQNTDAVMQKIEEFKQGLQSDQLSITDSYKMLDEIVAFMRSVELGRDELKFLRENLHAARQPLADKVKTKELEKLEQDEGRARTKRQKLADLKQEVNTLLHSSSSYKDAPSLITARDTLLEKIHSSQLLKAEKLDLERLLKPLRDVITDKQEHALMSLSDDDRQALQHLKEVLNQRKSRRQEIKDQLELLRKAKGSSGLGFEQAMEYNTQMQEAKERLDKINLGILEIESRLTEIEQTT